MQGKLEPRATTQLQSFGTLNTSGIGRRESVSIFLLWWNCVWQIAEASFCVSLHVGGAAQLLALWTPQNSKTLTSVWGSEIELPQVFLASKLQDVFMVNSKTLTFFFLFNFLCSAEHQLTIFTTLACVASCVHSRLIMVYKWTHTHTQYDSWGSWERSMKTGCNTKPFRGLY